MVETMCVPLDGTVHPGSLHVSCVPIGRIPCGRNVEMESESQEISDLSVAAAVVDGASVVAETERFD